MSPLSRKFLKWSAGICGALLLLLAALIVAIQMLLVRAPQYRVELQQQVLERTGVAIEVSELRARWRAFGPELQFGGTVLHEPGNSVPLMTARGGSVGLDIWTSVTSGRLIAGRFTLDAPRLAIQRSAEGRLEIVGRNGLEAREFDVDQLPVGRLRVTNAEITYRDLQTGRGPWVLNAIQLDVHRRAGRLVVDGDARLPPALGGTVTFEGGARGKFAPFDKLRWSVSIGAGALDLAKWVDVIPDNARVPRSGRGALRLGVGFIGARMQSFSINADLAQVSWNVPAWSVQLPAADPLVIQDSAAVSEPPQMTPAVNEAPANVQTLSYARLTGELQLDRVPEGWSATARHLVLAQANEWLPPAEISVVCSGSAADVFRAKGRVHDLNLASLWPLLSYLPENERNAQLRALQLSGLVNELQFDVDRDAQRPTRFTAQGKFSGIGFAAVRKQPGLQGLNGQFSATQTGGEARIDSRSLDFTLPRWFRDELHATQLQGTLKWTQDTQGWRIQTPDIDIVSADGRAAGSMDLTLPAAADASPVLHMDVVGQGLNVLSLPRYLPAGRLGARTVEWLDHAFKSGRVTEARLHYGGPTRSFPFRGNEGLFLINARIEDLTLHYQDGWAPAVKVATEVEFRNQGMTAQAQTGEVHGVMFEKITAAIPDFRDAELNIEGRAAGDMNDALTYVQSSPVAPALGELFANLRGTGKTVFDVKLSLPFKRLKEYRLATAAHIADGTAAAQGFAAQVTELSGILRVREHGLSTSDLKGRFLGAPVNIGIREGSTPSAGARETLVFAQGGVQAAELTKLWKAPSSVGLAGITQWRMNARFANAGGKPQQYYTLTSDLRGVQLALPEPFGKVAASTRDLRVEAEITDPASALVRAQAGEVRALLKIARQAGGGWQLERGGVQLNGAVAAMPDHAGLRVEGSLQTLVLDDWLRLRESASGAGGGKAVADYLHAANLRVGTFKLFGYTATDVRAVLQATNEGWRVDIAAPQATGGLIVPYDLSGSRALTGQFQHLVLGERDAPSGEGTPLDPGKFPALQVRIDDFEFGRRQLGSVEATLDRIPGGLKLATFRASGAAFTAEATGQWVASPEGSTCNIDLLLTSSDVLQTLKALDYGSPLDAKHGELQAKIAWSGGIDEHFLSRASGTVRLDINSGQLLNVQPGAGRVLGLLSVAALPRRLSLDFSDVTDKGLSFDTIHGDFELREGNAYTSNLLLSGPAAEIGIAGRTGLGAHDYDQTAVVTGNLGSSLPAAGLLAGGPAVGAALLLFSQIFKEPLKGITRGYYRITGSWDKPVVERVDSAEVKDAAATIESH